MGNPIQNLGDYNKIREALQAVGGNKEILYKLIEDTAVAKASPKIFRKGGIVGSAITLGLCGACYLGYKGHIFLKDRKQKIVNEPTLKQEFFETFKAELSKKDDDECADCESEN